MCGALWVGVLFVLTSAVSGAPYNCADKEGAYVVRINIHLDQQVLLALQARYAVQAMQQSEMETGATYFFRNLFDDVNREMMPLGVQVQAVFKNISIEDYQPIYDRSKCAPEDPIPEITRGNIVLQKIRMKEAVENRILVFFCPERVAFFPQGIFITSGPCQSAMSIVYSALPFFYQKVYEMVLSIASGGSIAMKGTVAGNRMFTAALCSNVKKCSKSGSNKPSSSPMGGFMGGNTSSPTGKPPEPEVFSYIRDLKAVRHLSDGRYVLKDGEKVREYDLYDDLYLKNHRGKHYSVDLYGEEE